MDTIRILLAANDTYAMPLTVAAHSAVTHLAAGRSIEVHVVDDGMSEANKHRATSAIRKSSPQAKVLWHETDLMQFVDVNVRHYSKASLARLLAPHIFGEDVDRVLYLDSDLIVEADISPLWEIELGDKPIWAVQNGFDWEFRELFGQIFPGEVTAPDARYFNSGVLLMNLREWRRQSITDRTIELLQIHHEKLSFPDQDALNLVARGHWGRLPSRWNKQVIRLGQPESARANEPGILHYSSFKPWHAEYQWPGAAKFHMAYIRSGWEPHIWALRTAAQLFVAQVISRNTSRVARRLNPRAT